MSVKEKEEKRGFSVRPSHLDIWAKDSLINSSGFKGYYTVAQLITLSFLICSHTIKSFSNRPLVEYNLYNTYIHKDIGMVLFTWPLLYLYSHLAWLLVLFAQKVNINYVTKSFLQHFSQAVPFAFSTWLVISRDWTFTHNAFLFCNLCIFFMKMHSYTEYHKTHKPCKASLSLSNFTYFLWAPTLVYRLQYPRSVHGIRFFYIVYKMFEAGTCVLLFYVIFQESIIDTVNNKEKYTFIEFMARMVFPFFCLFQTSFIFVFESYCNLFAEITQFGDRMFYQDYWNSTNYDEFARKWNRPIHQFLFEHIYIYLYKQKKYSKNIANFATFIFSALLHEMILSICFMFIRPYLFTAMIFQIFCIIALQPCQGKYLGNLIFWLGLIFGIPTLVSLYLIGNQNN